MDSVLWSWLHNPFVFPGGRQCWVTTLLEKWMLDCEDNKLMKKRSGPSRTSETSLSYASCPLWLRKPRVGLSKLVPLAQKPGANPVTRTIFRELTSGFDGAHAPALILCQINVQHHATQITDGLYEDSTVPSVRVDVSCQSVFLFNWAECKIYICIV
jgi:hypothetical protein